MLINFGILHNKYDIFCTILLSFPARERGLKYPTIVVKWKEDGSFPARERLFIKVVNWCIENRKCKNRTNICAYSVLFAFKMVYWIEKRKPVIFVPHTKKYPWLPHTLQSAISSLTIRLWQHSSTANSKSSSQRMQWSIFYPSMALIDFGCWNVYFIHFFRII